MSEGWDWSRWIPRVRDVREFPDQEFLGLVEAERLGRLGRFRAWKSEADPNCFDGKIARLVGIEPAPEGRTGQATQEERIRVRTGSKLFPGDGSVQEALLRLEPSSYFRWLSVALETTAAGALKIDHEFPFLRAVLEELNRRVMPGVTPLDLFHHQIAVMVLLVRRDGREGLEILTHLRGAKQTSDVPGRLSAHGGLIDVLPDGSIEAPIQTAIREIAEETGIEIADRVKPDQVFFPSYLPQEAAVTLGTVVQVLPGCEPTRTTDDGASFWTPLGRLLPALSALDPSVERLCRHVERAADLKLERAIELAPDFRDCLMQAFGRRL